MKEYRVSDITLGHGKTDKKPLQAKLNALVAEGWDIEQLVQAGDTLLIVSSKTVA